MELKKLNISNLPNIRFNKSNLIEQVRTMMRVLHYSKRTEEAYINWIKDFISFHKGKEISGFDEDDLSKYISYLAVKPGVVCCYFSIQTYIKKRHK